MKIGDLFKGTIEKIVPGGNGMLHAPDGTVVFVNAALPQESGVFRITGVKKSFLRAEFERLDSASPHRIQSTCPYSARCVNCTYRHCDYEYEVELKNSQLRELLGDLLTSDDALLKPVPSPAADNYRNKAQLHAHRAGKLIDLGYIKEDNQSVVDIPECKLLNAAINQEIAKLRNDHGFMSSLHDHIELTFRHCSLDDQVTFWRNQPPSRASWLKENLNGIPFSIPVGGFCQVNWAAAQQLATAAANLINETSPEMLLDLYCGAGFFSCAAVQEGFVGGIRGVELENESIKCAEYNLKIRNHSNYKLVSGDASAQIDTILQAIPRNTLGIIDPPRIGLHGKVTNAIGKSELSRLIYVSCDPATLARDIRRLGVFGFKLKTAQMFDLFPRTKHFETLSFLERV